MTLRGLWTAVVVFFTTLATALGGAIATSLRPGSDATIVLGRIWSRVNLRAAGARVTWEDLENARVHQPCVYVCNHQSNLDIWAIMAVLPKRTRFLAKHSLFRVPILGWALRVSEFISVDRTNRASAIRSLDEAGRKIRAGRPVVVFAEGTRSAGDTLAPFKKGPFHLALAAGVPIVPVAIRGSGKVMPPRGLAVRSGPVHVRFCDPIDVEPFQPKNVRGLLETVRATIAAELAREAPGTRTSGETATAASS